MGGAIVLAFVSVSAVGGIDAMKAKLGAAHPAFCAPDVRFGSADAVLAIWPPSVRRHVGPAGRSPSRLCSASRGGRRGIPARSRAAAGTSRRTCSRARTSATAVPPLSTSTSRTTRCGAGPGSSSALCSLVIYGGVAAQPRDRRRRSRPSNYVQMMVDYLPVGFRGLMLASFAAAYMSTRRPR